MAAADVESGEEKEGAMPECTATEFLARHPGVTSLIITQLLEVEEAHKISFASVAAAAWALLGLYRHVWGRRILPNGD